MSDKTFNAKSEESKLRGEAEKAADLYGAGRPVEAMQAGHTLLSEVNTFWNDPQKRNAVGTALEQSNGDWHYFYSFPVEVSVDGTSARQFKFSMPGEYDNGGIVPELTIGDMNESSKLTVELSDSSNDLSHKASQTIKVDK